MKKTKSFLKKEKVLDKKELAARKEAIKNLGSLSVAVKKLAKDLNIGSFIIPLEIVEKYVKNQEKKFRVKSKRKRVR